MATTLSRDKINENQIFPVEILRSLLPMILAGLHSTQIRIRQSTYRFLIAGNILGGMRWLVENDGIKFLKAFDHAREEFEAETSDSYGRRVDQVNDFGTMMLGAMVEYGQIHPLTVKPLVPTGNGEIKWVWFDPDGKEFALGTEEVYTEEERAKVDGLIEARVNNFMNTLMNREREKPNGLRRWSY
jgi:hypothetical protein